MPSRGNAAERLPLLWAREQARVRWLQKLAATRSHRELHSCSARACVSVSLTEIFAEHDGRVLLNGGRRVALHGADHFDDRSSLPRHSNLLRCNHHIHVHCTHSNQAAIENKRMHTRHREHEHSKQTVSRQR